MEIKHTEEDLRLYELVKNLFERLYAKGRIEYETWLGSNEAWFTLRPNKRATIVTIFIKPDFDKVNPLSDDYDQEYVDILRSLRDINDLRKYMGEPNLVIDVEFDWDSVGQERLTGLNVEFQKITIEIARDIIRNENLEMTEEEFFETYEFGLYPIFWDSEGDITIDVVSNSEFCKDIGLTKIWEYILKKLGEVGMGLPQTYNSLCGKDR